MAFPTTAIIDNFNRANETVLGTSSSGVAWLAPVPTGDGTLNVVGNRLTGDGISSFCAQELSPLYGLDQEGYIDVPVLSSGVENVSFYFRVTAWSPNITGYELEVTTAATLNWQVYEVTNSVFVQIGTSITQAVAANDGVGFAATGVNPTVIDLKYRPGAAGSWTSLGTRSDSTAVHQTGSSRLGLEVPANVVTQPVLDNFGGGTVVAPAPTGVPAYGAFGVPHGIGEGTLDDAGSATMQLMLTGPVPVGDHILLAVAANKVGNSLTSVTDSKGNSYQIDASSSGATNANLWLLSCRVAYGLLAGDVLTATFGDATTNHKVMSADRVTGLLPAAWFDTSSTGSGTDVFWNTGATALTAQADAIVYGGSFNNSSSRETSLPAGDQNERHDFSSPQALNLTICYKRATARGSFSLSGQWSGSASETRKDAVVVYKLLPAQAVPHAFQDGNWKEREGFQRNAFQLPDATDAFITQHRDSFQIGAFQRVGATEAFQPQAYDDEAFQEGPEAFQDLVFQPDAFQEDEPLAAAAATGTVIFVPGLASSEALGVPNLLLTLRAIGVTSGEALGLVRLLQTIRPAGVASAAALGVPQLRLLLNAIGVQTGAQFGLAKLAQRILLGPGTDAAALGVPHLALVVYPPGAASGQAFGQPRLLLGAPLQGVGSAEALGLARLLQTIRAIAVQSGEALGRPLVFIGNPPVTIVLAGITDDRAFQRDGFQYGAFQLRDPGGIAKLLLGAPLQGIAGGQQLGLAKLLQTVRAIGVTSSTAVGVPRLALVVYPPGAASAGALGITRLMLGAPLQGISSGASFGLARLALTVRAIAVQGGEQLGIPYVVVIPAGGFLSVPGSVKLSERAAFPVLLSERAPTTVVITDVGTFDVRVCEIADEQVLICEQSPYGLRVSDLPGG